MPTQPHTCAPQCPKELSLPEAQYYLDRVIEELPSHSKVLILIKVSYSGVVRTHTQTHTHTHTHFFYISFMQQQYRAKEMVLV